MRHFKAVAEGVLSVAGAVTQLSDYLCKLTIHVFDARFEKRLFGGLEDLDLNVLLRPFYYFLYAGRMDPAVHDQPLQRESGHFAAHGIKAAQRDGLRCVVDDEINSGECFKSPDVAAFAPDDTSLHLIGGKVYDADDHVGGKFNAAALDGCRDDLLSLAVRLAFRAFFKLFEAQPYNMVRVGLNLGKKLFAGLLARQLGDLLQFRDEFLLLCGEPVQLFLYMFIAVLEFFFFAADVLDLFVEVFFFLFQPALGTLELPAALFRVAVEFLPQSVYLFFALG